MDGLAHIQKSQFFTYALQRLRQDPCGLTMRWKAEWSWKAEGSVPHNRIFSFSSRVSQRVGRRTVEAAFSRRSVETQRGPGLFQREQRLVPVVGGRRSSGAIYKFSI